MTTETSTRLLDTAEQLIRQRGYNAFSFKDLAENVGIRTASIHYHFPTKADLGTSLMKRYVRQLEEALEAIDRRTGGAKSKLKSFIKLYRDTEAQGAICLCGSLASDVETLPAELQEVVTSYLDRSEGWIAQQIADGVRAGEFGFGGRPAEAATALLSSLQGGLILSRTRSERSVLDPVQRTFFRLLEST